jgi:peroxiredoxin (alkyl hydroperoxide reductase subunit C)
VTTNQISSAIIFLTVTLVFGAVPLKAEEVARLDKNMQHPCCLSNLSSMLEREKNFARVGHPAPDFNLEAVVGTASGPGFKRLKLQEYRGKWLVLFFYPADFTTVCPTEIRGFNEAVETFKKLNAEILAVSTDSKWSHLTWIKSGELGSLKYPLLADFNKEMSRQYRVLDENAGVALRGLFLIDPQGIIQYQVTHNQDIGRSVDETVRALEALQTGGMCPLGWKPGQKTIPK